MLHARRPWRDARGAGVLRLHVNEIPTRSPMCRDALAESSGWGAAEGPPRALPAQAPHARMVANVPRPHGIGRQDGRIHRSRQPLRVRVRVRVRVRNIDSGRGPSSLLVSGRGESHLPAHTNRQFAVAVRGRHRPGVSGVDRHLVTRRPAWRIQWKQHCR